MVPRGLYFQIRRPSEDSFFCIHIASIKVQASKIGGLLIVMNLSAYAENK
jgi:hypothetical protein